MWGMIHGLYQGEAGSCHGDGMTRNAVFKRIEPRSLIGTGHQQSVPLRHRPFMRRAFTCMIGVERKNEPVQKAPPAGSRIREKTVHLRRKPGCSKIRCNLALIAHYPAVETKYPAHRVCGVRSGRKFTLWESPGAKSGDHPPGPAILALDLRVTRAPQPSAGRKERQGLKQIGLSCPVFACQNDQPALGGPGKPFVIAEIGEDEPADLQGRGAALRVQTRIGIST